MGNKDYRLGVVLVAAILCFSMIGCATESDAMQGNAPTTTATVLPDLPEAAFVYNTDLSVTYISYGYPPGMFREELDPNEISVLVPDDRFPCTGSAAWDGNGELMWVDLNVRVGEYGVSLYFPVSFGLSSPDIWVNDPQYTQCNGLPMEIVELPYGWKSTMLRATFALGEQNVVVTGVFADDELERCRSDFETLIRWLSLYNSRKPDLSAVSYSVIPEFYNLELTQQEAYEDEIFGHLLPRYLPRSSETAQRIKFSRDKNYETESLSGEWEWDRLYLFWRIKHFEQEHALRLVEEDLLTAVKEDPLSVFRIEDISVEILQELKSANYSSDSISVRMKVGDFVVQISTRGVSPEELYVMIQGVQR